MFMSAQDASVPVRSTVPSDDLNQDEYEQITPYHRWYGGFVFLLRMRWMDAVSHSST